MAANAQAESRSSAGAIIPLIAGMFVVLGALALYILLSNILAVIGARTPDEDFGTTLLRYLNDYGIIIPLVQLGIGAYLVRLGIQVWQRSIRAASWARQFLLWGMIAAGAVTAQSLSAAIGQSLAGADAYIVPVIAALAVMIFGYFYFWLGNNVDAFEGQETLAQSSSRFAWNLLVPTLLIMVVVALRPLEATFVASLTNERFAAGASDEVEFVGFNNYAQLLGIRFDSVDCIRDDSGVCTLDRNGETAYPRGRDALDESYTTLRFREVSTFNIGESRVLFSARDQTFWQAIGNTLGFTFFSVTIELLLGLFIAMVINSKFPGRGLMRAAMLVPWAIPTVVSAKLWSVMLRDNTSGVFNAFIVSIQSFLGMPQETVAWLARPEWQVPALVMVDVWKTTPFMALILLAGLQTIPSDIYEAADVDGANRVTQFLRLTVPLLRPTIAVALVFRTLDAVRVFDVFQVLLAQKQYSMATYNYYTLINSQELGYASAVGVVMFAIILVFTIAYVRILGVNAE
jgi:trehalose/maltose transport system permease protein